MGLFYCEQVQQRTKKLPLLPKNHAKKRQEHQRGQGADITRNLEQIEF